MKNVILTFALMVIIAAASARAADKADALAIIVSKKTAFANVQSNDLAKYFRGEKTRDADGNKIMILMREHGSAERAAALKYIYKMTEQEYQTYFLQATFTGQVMSTPKKLNTASAVRQFVSDNPGAIGYVRVADLDDTVKVLKVDGKGPGDDDYLLKTN